MDGHGDGCTAFSFAIMHGISAPYFLFSNMQYFNVSVMPHFDCNSMSCCTDFVDSSDQIPNRFLLLCQADLIVQYPFCSVVNFHDILIQNQIIDVLSRDATIEIKPLTDPDANVWLDTIQMIPTQDPDSMIPMLNMLDPYDLSERYVRECTDHNLEYVFT